jgi:hypothetical protein
MGILGVTNDERGLSMQRLPVTTKVSIGEPPNKAKGKNYPSRLDHFQFLEKVMVDGEGVWSVDEGVTNAMTAAYGTNKPTEIGIVLLDDDPENVFKTSLAWWKATEWQCKGSLVQVEPTVFAMQATRRTEKHPEGEPWPGNYKYSNGEKKGQPVEPCGDACPDLEAGRCKPSGDLYFILEKYPSFGGVCRIHTTSWRSIRNISNGLQQIRSLLGGRLAGIRVSLKVSPEKIVFENDKGKQSSTGYILSLNLSAEDLPKLVSKMTEFSRMFQDTRKLLGVGTMVVEEEDNAAELAAEFYPALPAGEEEPVVQVPRAVIPQPERVSATPVSVPQSSSAPAKPAQAAKPPVASQPAKQNGTGNGAAKISDEQRKALQSAAAQAGWSNKEMGDAVKEFGFANMREITIDKFDAIYKRFTSGDAWDAMAQGEEQKA